MLSPRIRRLKLDHDSLFKRFSGWPLIRIVGTAGMPPELYRFQYLVRGLYVAPDGAILERNDHLLEVNLVSGLSAPCAAVPHAYTGLSSKFRR